MLDSESGGGHGLDSESGGSQVLDSEPRGGQKLTFESGVVKCSISSQEVVMHSILKFAQDFCKICARLKHYFLQRIS